jgi:hypothetical protein
MMKAIRSYETSVLTRATRRNIQEVCILVYREAAIISGSSKWSDFLQTIGAGPCEQGAFIIAGDQLPRDSKLSPPSGQQQTPIFTRKSRKR